MNLIIDVGNSQIKVAVFMQDELLSVEVRQLDTVLEYVEKIFERHDDIDHIMMSSVGNLPNSVIEFLENYASVLILSNRLNLPFINAYATPTTLGVDRIALVAAAFSNYPDKNCLIIDAGSCITYDFIDQEGYYKGG